MHFVTQWLLADAPSESLSCTNHSLRERLQGGVSQSCLVSAGSLSSVPRRGRGWCAWSTEAQGTAIYQQCPFRPGSTSNSNFTLLPLPLPLPAPSHSACLFLFLPPHSKPPMIIPVFWRIISENARNLSKSIGPAGPPLADTHIRVLPSVP